ncbi:O-antigen ligase like membrane protein [Pseudomonas reinekei]|uniref:Ligase n=1 Tax=Pseudomonas reinekei TaxID=395598 RepID=A0A1H0JS89_PSERE|nr:O-antigen ligase family protein [Pseudomonas reinekei]KAB0480397.1 O-antigen ligase family protein [Pseudomonas reinekei]OLT99141.1 ligase [Pseudomonas reinekei]SDO46399.1 O-antigen ligase like membrane protein [Pseudomonas reinekei]
MNESYFIKNSCAIAAGAGTAILLSQDPGAVFYIGAAGALLLLLMALKSPWHGLLALFPMAFAMRPAPTSLGLQELSFAALLAIIFAVSVLQLLRTYEIKDALKIFAAPMLVGFLVLGINLAIALHNHVPLSDWLRGVIPFLFIYALIPVCILVSHDHARIYWVGGSVATLIFLTAGYIVFYYFYQGIWRPYWIDPSDAQAIKLTKEAASHNANAIGPMRDRITMLLAQATDSLLPVGMVAGFVTCILSRQKQITAISALMSLLCMTAVLITFTRSMLLSALLVIMLFSAFIFVFHTKLRKKLIVSAVALGICGLLFIFSTGMQQIWLGRMSLLIESGIEAVVNWKPEPESGSGMAQTKENADFNVTSRVVEYGIAWDMFKSHPILGNGLGVKHEMRWETSSGESFTQRVAYIHNWPLYTLMVGGLLGIITYALVLLGPIFSRVTSIRIESAHWTILRTVVLTMVIYGLFFAVFRLITFNLLLATAWGLILTQTLSRAPKNQSNDRKSAESGAPSVTPSSPMQSTADKKNTELQG